MLDWPENDFRIYCCNLGNECNETILGAAFKKYPSFSMCKVVRDKKTMKSKGFGFVSLLDVDDYARAMKEMNGKYVGNRPIMLKPSKWVDKSVAHSYGLVNQPNHPEQIKEFKQNKAGSLTEKYASLLSAKQKAELDSVLAAQKKLN